MQTVIIDVRTPAEYADYAFPGAINFPSEEYSSVSFMPYKAQHIALVCESGNRAKTIRKQLLQDGFDHVSILSVQMDAVNRSQNTTKWSIDRQFRLTLAVLLGIFLLSVYLAPTHLIAIPIILFSGLLYSAVANNCYLKIFIAKLPWNRGMKVN